MEQKDEYMKKELKKFADAMASDYKEKNMIKDFCTIKDYDGEEKNFRQIGQKVRLPKEFFMKEEGVSKDNTVLASDFVRSLINGEEYFVLSEIQKSKKVRKTFLSNFNYPELAEVISEIDNPTNIFLPLEPFFKRLYDFFYKYPNKIKFVSRGPPLLFANGKWIQIHWITSDKEIDKIIVTNKEKIEIIQKKYEEAKKPKNTGKIIKEYEKFSQGKRLMLYFMNKDKKDFYFIFRTVISRPKLTKDSAIVVDIDKLQNETSQNSEKER